MSKLSQAGMNITNRFLAGEKKGAEARVFHKDAWVCYSKTGSALKAISTSVNKLKRGKYEFFKT